MKARCVVPGRFDVTETRLAGLVILDKKIIRDDRGFFERLFCSDDLAEHTHGKNIVQINRTSTRKTGVVRGMHYQLPPYSEVKFVTCTKGKIFDVAVDLRSDSATFLQWQGEILSKENHRTLLIPEGFAHGFQTLTDDCELVYLHTERYTPQAEAALNATDARLAIEWPLDITERSNRDCEHAFISENFRGVSL